MFCKQCGARISENAIICAKCAHPTRPSGNNQQAAAEDRGGCLWIFLGAILGIISLILYFVWRHDKPLRAKAILMGWIIGMIIGLAVGMIVGFVVMGLIMSGVIYLPAAVMPLISLGGIL